MKSMAGAHKPRQASKRKLQDNTSTSQVLIEIEDGNDRVLARGRGFTSRGRPKKSFVPGRIARSAKASNVAAISTTTTTRLASNASSTTTAAAATPSTQAAAAKQAHSKVRRIDCRRPQDWKKDTVTTSGRKRSLSTVEWRQRQETSHRLHYDSLQTPSRLACIG